MIIASSFFCVHSCLHIFVHGVLVSVLLSPILQGESTSRTTRATGRESITPAAVKMREANQACSDEERTHLGILKAEGSSGLHRVPSTVAPTSCSDYGSTSECESGAEAPRGAGRAQQSLGFFGDYPPLDASRQNGFPGLSAGSSVGGARDGGFFGSQSSRRAVSAAGSGGTPSQGATFRRESGPGPEASRPALVTKDFFLTDSEAEGSGAEAASRRESGPDSEASRPALETKDFFLTDSEAENSLCVNRVNRGGREKDNAARIPPPCCGSRDGICAASGAEGDVESGHEGIGGPSESESGTESTSPVMRRPPLDPKSIYVVGRSNSSAQKAGRAVRRSASPVARSTTSAQKAGRAVRRSASPRLSRRAGAKAGARPSAKGTKWSTIFFARERFST